METTFSSVLLQGLCQRPPEAVAMVSGSSAYPELRGRVSFWQTKLGVVVLAEVQGLPQTQGECQRPVFAMHIHSGSSCTGNAEDPFADTDGHYDNSGCKHPAHAGDLPPLFSNQGSAWGAVLTDRFSLKEVVGRAVIIHRGADDFTTQPSGNAGAKIACGIIKSLNK